MFENPKVQQEGVIRWLNSKDPILVHLAENYLDQELPSEQELTDILMFFNVFALGCIEMGEKELADKFKRRATLFAVNLPALGFSLDYRKEYVKNLIVPGPARRIIYKACARAATIMCDLKRYLDIGG